MRVGDGSGESSKGGNKMKIYVTRHGQVAPDTEYLGDENHPKGDAPLSSLGRRQAELLGERLALEGFSGRIYSSPFIRTMETADIVAKKVGSTVIPTPFLHEIFRSSGMVDGFVGRSLDELKSLFSSIDDSATLSSRWWVDTAETNEDARRRVSLGMEKLLREVNEDILIVGHGASVDAALLYLTASEDHRPVYNASYSVFDKETKRGVRNSSSHLPIGMITYNSVAYLDKEIKIDIPDGISEEKGLRILHIGDTLSTTYPYYISLVKKLKPDIIIHTGDTADEMKVGRDESVRELYFDRVKGFLDKLSEHSQRIIWVPGNNDIKERVRELCPYIECTEQGSVIELCGTRISLAHEKENLKDGADVYLYGHSSRYETWSAERNTADSAELYFNTMWYPTFFILPEKRFYYFSRPSVV